MVSKKDFCIIAQARSGSTLLRHAFNEHPNAICHGEVLSRICVDGLQCKKQTLFSNIQQLGLSFGVQQWINGKQSGDNLSELKAKVGVKSFLRKRDANVARYLESCVYNIDSTCIGFKVVYEDLFYSRASKEIFDFLKDRNIAVVHLTRKNILRAFVSRMRMGKFGITHSSHKNSSKTPDSVSIDPNKLRNYQMKQQQFSQSIIDRLGDQIVVEAFYEQLEEGYHQTIRALGLDEYDMVRKLEPVGIRALDEYITNYEEVAEFDFQ